MKNQNDYQEKMLFIAVYSRSLESNDSPGTAQRLAERAVTDFREFFNTKGEEDESNSDSRG